MAFVLVASVDYAANAVALLGSPFGLTPWAGITMRAAFHYREMGVKRTPARIDRVKRVLLERLARNPTLRGLITNDLALSLYADKRPGLRSRIFYFSDPVRPFPVGTSRAEARQKLNIPDGCPVILVYGVITRRKGIDALLSATRESNWPPETCIMLAGIQDSDATEVLNSPDAKRLREHGKLIELRHYLSDAEEDLVFCACDVVWVGYRGHFGMSGVLVQAGLAGKPVVASDSGLIGWITEKYGTGITVNPDDPHEVADAIRTLIDDSGQNSAFADRGRKAFAAHTIGAAQDTIFALIGQLSEAE